MLERNCNGTDHKGNRRTSELTTKGDRIKAEAKTRTAKYRDGEGFVQELATGCADKDAANAVLSDLKKRAQHVKAKILSPEQDRIADHAGIPIGEHIEEFLEISTSQGNARRQGEALRNQTLRNCGRLQVPDALRFVGRSARKMARAATHRRPRLGRGGLQRLS